MGVCMEADMETDKVGHMSDSVRLYCFQLKPFENKHSWSPCDSNQLKYNTNKKPKDGQLQPGNGGISG